MGMLNIHAHDEHMKLDIKSSAQEKTIIGYTCTCKNNNDYNYNNGMHCLTIIII